MKERKMMGGVEKWRTFLRVGSADANGSLNIVF